MEFRANVPQSELRYIYCAGDVLGLPSSNEGWPNVLLESMACGTPVVAAPVGGIPEILDAGAPALMVAESDPRAWARGLADVAGMMLAPATVRHYALRFSWDDVVSRQCALYESVAVTRRIQRQRA